MDYMKKQAPSSVSKRNIPKIIFSLMLLFSLLISLPVQAETTYRFPVEDGDLSIYEGLDENWNNILLIGSDTRRNTFDEGRADALIILSLHRETGEIRLTSLARDMWINIPGTHFSDKINTAYHYGGPELMMKAVNETLHLNIQQYVIINFFSFCDVIDRLGGVEIDLTRTEALYINRNISGATRYTHAEITPLKEEAGPALLCGAQALTYARTRYLDSDFGRTQRQRTVIVAVLDKVRALPFSQQLQFALECYACLSTNLLVSDLADCLQSVTDETPPSISQLSLPAEGFYHHDNTDGAARIIFRQDAIVEQAHRFIYGNTAAPSQETP